MTNHTTLKSQIQDPFAADLTVLQKLTGVQVSPQIIPDWGTFYEQEILDSCRVLATVIQLQQTATNQLKEEILNQENALKTLTPLELNLLPKRETKIKQEDISARTEILYALAAEMKIKDLHNILLRLQRAGLIEDAYHYDASSTATRIGYRIPKTMLPVAYDLVEKWVTDATK